MCVCACLTAWKDMKGVIGVSTLAPRSTSVSRNTLSCHIELFSVRTLDTELSASPFVSFSRCLSPACFPNNHQICFGTLGAKHRSHSNQHPPLFHVSLTKLQPPSHLLMPQRGLEQNSDMPTVIQFPPSLGIRRTSSHTVVTDAPPAAPHR